MAKFSVQYFSKTRKQRIRSDLVLSGEPDLLIDNGVEERAPRLRTWPVNFSLDADRLEIAGNVGLNASRVIVEWRKFQDHALAKACKYADWDAAWRNWARTAVEGWKGQQKPQPEPPRRSVP